MKSRKHHFVSRYYLRAWAQQEKIWCGCDGNVFQANLDRVANKRDFYKLKQLTLSDINFINKFVIQGSKEGLQRVNTEWIRLFNMVFQAKMKAEEKGISDKQLDLLIEEGIYNIEESYHSSLENHLKQYISLLRKGQISFYHNDEDKISFLYLISVQYMRTEKVKQNVIANMNRCNGIDIGKVWNVLSHIFATNIGNGLYTSTLPYKLVLLNNYTKIEFITGDQPIINTFASEFKEFNPPEDLEFYYPLSPDVALLITKSEIYDQTNMIMTEEQICQWNNMICRQAYRQIYARCKETLYRYIDRNIQLSDKVL